jgi:hypothetical protein
MGLRPTQGDEKRLLLSNLLPWKRSSPLVIPTGAYPNSCFATSDRSTCAAFIKESRMKFASATNLDRNSGQRSGGISVWMLFLGSDFRQSVPEFLLRYVRQVNVCGLL